VAAQAELNKARNFKQWFKKGLYIATLMTASSSSLLRGNIPWTLHRTKPDHLYLKPAASASPSSIPSRTASSPSTGSPRCSSRNTNHEEHQPAHLTLKDPTVPVNVNLHKFAGPEAATARRACTSSSSTEDGKRAAADQRAELRALQDLRHQGPDAEHRVGHARRRRRAELPEHVGFFCGHLRTRCSRCCSGRVTGRRVPPRNKGGEARGVREKGCRVGVMRPERKPRQERGNALGPVA
jgi:hypothetical protein